MVLLTAVFPLGLFLLGCSMSEVDWRHGAWSTIFLLLAWTFCREYSAADWVYAVAPLALGFYFLFKLGLAGERVHRPLRFWL